MNIDKSKLTYKAFYPDGEPVKRNDSMVSAHNGELYEFKFVAWDKAHLAPMVHAINVDRDTSAITILSPGVLGLVAYAVI